MTIVARRARVWAQWAGAQAGESRLLRKFPKPGADELLDTDRYVRRRRAPNLRHPALPPMKKFPLHLVGDDGPPHRAADGQSRDPVPDAGQREFSSAFENAPIGMALLAPDSRRLRVNRALCRMLGYSEEEMVSPAVHYITHPDDLAEDMRQRGLCLAGEKDTYQREKRYLHRDGHVLWGHLTCTLVRDERGVPVHFISQLQDISERKRAEEALRKSEERFRSLTMLSSDWYWEQDSEFRFTAFSGSEQAGAWIAEQKGSIGLRRWEIPGVYPLGGTWDEHRALLQAWQPFFNFQYMCRVEGEPPRYLSTSGEPVFDEGGTLIGYRGTARDITSEKAAEQELRNAQALLHMAAQVGRLGAWAYEVGPAVGDVVGRGVRHPRRPAGLRAHFAAGAGILRPAVPGHDAPHAARLPARRQPLRHRGAARHRQGPHDLGARDRRGRVGRAGGGAPAAGRLPGHFAGQARRRGNPRAGAAADHHARKPHGRVLHRRSPMAVHICERAGRAPHAPAPLGTAGPAAVRRLPRNRCHAGSRALRTRDERARGRAVRGVLPPVRHLAPGQGVSLGAGPGGGHQGRDRARSRAARDHEAERGTRGARAAAHRPAGSRQQGARGVFLFHRARPARAAKLDRRVQPDAGGRARLATGRAAAALPQPHSRRGQADERADGWPARAGQPVTRQPAQRDRSTWRHWRVPPWRHAARARRSARWRCTSRPRCP